MKSKKKKIIIIVFCALFAVTAVCAFFSVFTKRNKNINKITDSTLYVLFESGEDVVAVPEEDILSFKGAYSDLNNEIYYSGLNSSEKLLYKIYEYAFENCYNSFYVNNGVFTNCVYNDIEILIFLSLDTPLVEQNFEIRTSAQTTPLEVVVNEKEKCFENFTHYQLEMNSEDLMAKKKLSVEKADEIVNNIPADLTKAEKAEYLYRYLCENVSYKGYGDEKSICYIYDALIDGETHCDGFANALSLLYRKAGIKCFEKAYYDSPAKKSVLSVIGTSEKEKTVEYYKTPTGHTWNCFKINGKWYDCDCTFDSKDNLEKRLVKDVFYGFGTPGGFVAEYKDFAYKDLTPECSSSFLKEPDCTFETINDDGIENEIYEAMKKSENGVVFISFTENNKNIKSLAKRICDKNDISVYYGSCESSPLLVYFAFKN